MSELDIITLQVPILLTVAVGWFIVRIRLLEAAMVKIGAAVHEATGVHLQMLVSNIPTIQALRKGKPQKTPILDCRQQHAVPVGQTVI